MANENSDKKRKDVTNSLVDNYSNELSSYKEFDIKYEPVKPKIANYDAMKKVIDEISKRYQSTIIQNKDEAYSINKRGGLLTKLRALRNEIENKQRQVHRDAKKSYKEMDDDLNVLINNIDLSINSLKDQVDKFQIREYEKKTEELTNMFETEKNSKQFENKIPDFFDFDMFLEFNQSIYKDSKTKVKKTIVKELARVYKDYEQIWAKKEQYPSDSYYQTAINTYISTMDVNKSILLGIEKYEEDIKIAERIRQEGLLKEQRQKELEEQQKQKELEQANQEKLNQDKDVVINKESQQKVYIVMVTEDIKGAKLIKDFAQQNNIKVAFKKVVK